LCTNETGDWQYLGSQAAEPENLDGVQSHWRAVLHALPPTSHRQMAELAPAGQLTAILQIQEGEAMNKPKCLLVLSCIATVLLTGCGSSSHTTTSNNVNGVFADAQVVGLSYACGSITDVTKAGGAFTCPAKSTVTFKVGGVTICSAPVQTFVTPVSCAQANGNPSADASTPSVVATAQFIISIGTPTGTQPGSLSTLTITSAEVQAAANLSLDFSTATQTELQTAVSTVNPGQTLASATTAQTELTGTVAANVAASYSGGYSGGSTGTWSLAIDASGSVSGSFTDTKNGTGSISGNLVNGTTYSGTAGNATWTGTVDTSKSPTTGKGLYLFNGTWTNGTDTGTFTN
jgi:hypothetical protein